LDDEDEIAAITSLNEVSEQPETEITEAIVADASGDSTSTDESTPENADDQQAPEENNEN
jgi:hypothetical protein